MSRHRDVSWIVQQIRKVLLGREWTTTQLRYKAYVSSRSPPHPLIPDGPARRLSANSYVDRDKRRPDELEIMKKQFHTAPPPPTPPPKSPKPDEPTKKIDDIKYVISFKQQPTIKQIFKDFYSLYGPLFIACHIGVSLTSLGFFCSIVWLTVDPIKYMPEMLVTMIGSAMSQMTGTGGKFVVAYAIHKIILPVRLVGAIWLTRTLSRLIKRQKAT